MIKILIFILLCSTKETQMANQLRTDLLVKQWYDSLPIDKMTKISPEMIWLISFRENSFYITEGTNQMKTLNNMSIMDYKKLNGGKIQSNATTLKKFASFNQAMNFWVDHIQTKQYPDMNAAMERKDIKAFIKAFALSPLDGGTYEDKVKDLVNMWDSVFMWQQSGYTAFAFDKSFKPLKTSYAQKKSVQYAINNHLTNLRSDVKIKTNDEEKEKEKKKQTNTQPESTPGLPTAANITAASSPTTQTPLPNPKQSTPVKSEVVVTNTTKPSLQPVVDHKLDEAISSVSIDGEARVKPSQQPRDEKSLLSKGWDALMSVVTPVVNAIASVFSSDDKDTKPAATVTTTKSKHPLKKSKITYIKTGWRDRLIPEWINIS